MLLQVKTLPVEHTHAQKNHKQTKKLRKLSEIIHCIKFQDIILVEERNTIYAILNILSKKSK